jgi:hypothetical protein
MTGQMQESLLGAPYGLQLLDLISHRQTTTLTDDDLDELLTQLDFHVSRYRGDYDEYVVELKSKAPQLQSLSGWLTQRMERWWHDLDRSDQVWLSPTSDPPEPSRLIPDLDRFHSEAPKPKRAFWTSTQVPAEISPWLYWVQFGEARRPGPYTFWRVAVSPTARVAEIHSPAAWSALARAYPSAEVGYTFTGRQHPPRSATRLDPDWSRVSRDWDGVHLSVGGWLTAEDAPVESGGVTTELRGWNMESTAWFRWSFTSVGPLELTNRKDELE